MASLNPSAASAPGRRPWTPARIALAVVLGLVLLAVAAVAWNWSHINRMADVATAYGARVGCACRYIGNRRLEDCIRDFEPGMEMVSLSEDEDRRQVTASIFLLSDDRARLRPVLGCVLEPKE